MRNNLGKVVTMAEAVRRLARPGTSIVLGAGLEAAIPFAAGHEIVRQGIKDLCLIGPISDTLFDMMIGGGVVKKVIAAWVGNVGAGIGYQFQRAADPGRDNPLLVEDHSNLSLATALDAGAMGVGFGVIGSLFGTDIERSNPHIVAVSCPFSGRRHLAVRAINPDLAIIHVQRADETGNAHYWGSLGVLPEAVAASRRVLVTAEEIVSTEVIRSDPNRTVIPGFRVSAVVEAPWGAHPSPVQGWYGHDDDFFLEYAKATKDAAGAETWMKEWVFDLPDRAAYAKKLGPKRLDGLRVRNSAPSATAEFGF